MDNLSFKSKLVKTIENGLSRFQNCTISAEGFAQHLIENGGMTESLIDLIEVSDLTTYNGVGNFEARSVKLAISNEFSKQGGSTEKETSQAEANPSLEDPPRSEQNAPKAVSTPPLIPPFKLNMGRIYFLKNKKFFDSGRKPDKNLRIEIVKECILQVTKKVENPDRNTMSKVFDQLAEIHSASFMEKLPNGKLFPGIMRKRLMDGIDNTVRPGRNNLQRNPTQQQYEKPRGKFAYGCIRWRIQNIPENETEQSLLQKKEEMKVTFVDTRPKRWKKDDIVEKITLTFKLQRDLINQNHEEATKEQKQKRYGKRKKQTTNAEENPENEDQAREIVTVTKVKEEWPFLFTYFGMKTHFELLTQAEAENLSSFITNSGEAVLKYFKNLRDETKDVIYKNTFKRMKRASNAAAEEDHQKRAEIKLKAIIIMVAHHLGEDYKELIILKEEFNVDTADENDLPVYPSLVAEAGNTLFEVDKYHMSIDMKILTSTKSFVEAMGVVFMSYFVLNLNYHPKTSATLEYIQRFAYSISPDEGHKRPVDAQGKGKASTNIIHPHVAKLNDLIRDFNENSSSESEKSGDELQS